MVSKRIAVLGLGLIGTERLEALAKMRAAGRPIEVVGTLDPFQVAPPTAPAGQRVDDLDALLNLDPDWVVIAVPHDSAGDLAQSCLRHGVNVLLEKPLGRTAAEARAIAAHASPEARLHVGFTYRFFSGIRHLLQDAQSNRFGDLVGVSMVLGHGGSPNDDQSWKLDPVRAGGGSLIDPGVHLLDLTRLLLGPNVALKCGHAWRGFWKTGIEEEVRLLFEGRTGVAASVDVSIVRWRSTFRIEVHGTDGYGIVEGRGRSYGPQTYRRGERWGWRSGTTQAESETTVCQGDGSEALQSELEALILGDEVQMPGPCTGQEAVAVMELLDACRHTLGLRSEFGAEG